MAGSFLDLVPPFEGETNKGEQEGGAKIAQTTQGASQKVVQILTTQLRSLGAETDSMVSQSPSSMASSAFVRKAVAAGGFAVGGLVS